jgi:hypothetical protein
MDFQIGANLSKTEIFRSAFVRKKGIRIAVFFTTLVQPPRSNTSFAATCLQIKAMSRERRPA